MLNVFILDSDTSSCYSLAADIERLGYQPHIYSTQTPLAELTQNFQQLQNKQATYTLQPVFVVVASGAGHPEQAGCLLAFLQALPSQTPVLGIHLGYYALLSLTGARLKPLSQLRHGQIAHMVFNKAPTEAFTKASSQIFCPTFIQSQQVTQVACYQTFTVDRIPSIYQIIAYEPVQPNQALIIQHRQQPKVGFNFNPESILTTEGNALLKQVFQNFAAQTKKGETFNGTL